MSVTTVGSAMYILFGDALGMSAVDIHLSDCTNRVTSQREVETHGCETSYRGSQSYILDRPTADGPSSSTLLSRVRTGIGTGDSAFQAFRKILTSIFSNVL
jgi:hypothetical protein